MASRQARRGVRHQRSPSHTSHTSLITSHFIATPRSTDTSDVSGPSFFHHAHATVVRRVVRSDGAAVRTRTGSQYTPIHLKLFRNVVDPERTFWIPKRTFRIQKTCVLDPKRTFGTCERSQETSLTGVVRSHCLLEMLQTAEEFRRRTSLQPRSSCRLA